MPPNASGPRRPSIRIQGSSQAAPLNSCSKPARSTPMAPGSYCVRAGEIRRASLSASVGVRSRPSVSPNAARVSS